MQTIDALLLITILSPLSSGIYAGLCAKQAQQAYQMCIAMLTLACVSLFALIYVYALQEAAAYRLVLYSWLTTAEISLSIGLLVDTMMLSVGGMVLLVSLLIHLYSIDYMRDDPGAIRFFSLLSLFTFAMMWLVASDNVVGLFLGWESVSLFSYCLIGFYHVKAPAGQASLKAFMMNRFGDCAFCLALVLIIGVTGHVAYADIFAQPTHWPRVVLWPGGASIALQDIVSTLLLIAAMTKSAQMPLHIWLPDSMVGPTPVSALLHAATMVTAGVYLLCRFGVLIMHNMMLLNIITLVGASSVLFMGLLALVQNDIKRVIAYSTMSQLGYMFIAIGTGAGGLAIYHLLLHGVSKACLFLAAGALIHVRHKQTIHDLAGSWPAMPLTVLCFLVGALSLSGIAPFAGFYSKDMILTMLVKRSLDLEYWGHWYIDIAVLIGTFLTPLYVFRVFWAIVAKPPLGKAPACYEAPALMTLPMIVLAAFSAVGGILGQSLILPYLIQVSAMNHTKVQQILENTSHLDLYIHAIDGPVLYISVLCIGVAWGVGFYWKQFKFLHRLFYFFAPIVTCNLGFDWLYARVVVYRYLSLSLWCTRVLEHACIDRTVEHHLAHGAQNLSRQSSRKQTGLLNHYIMLTCVVIAIMGGAIFFLI